MNVVRDHALRRSTGRSATGPDLKNQPHLTDTPHMRRCCFALVIALGALTTACGGANDQDRQAFERFRTDPLFAVAPAGTAIERDTVTAGAPWRGESRPGQDHARAVYMPTVSMPAARLATMYVEALENLGWEEISVECPTAPTPDITDLYVLRARRTAESGVVDAVRILATDRQDANTSASIVMSTPYHDADPFPEPDPDVPPDTSCVAAALAD